MYSLKELVFNPDGNFNLKYHQLVRGIYHFHYSRFLQYFNRSQILVLDGDLFKRDPYIGCKQAEEFLGLPPYIKRDHFVFNEERQLLCLRLDNGSRKCMGPSKGREHVYVSPEDTQRIQQFYRPHNKIFEEMLNYTFSWP